MKWATLKLIILGMLWQVQAVAQEAKQVHVLYLKIAQQERALLSNLDPIPVDLGVNGAQLGLSDNNTTGMFLGYKYHLEVQEFDQSEVESAKLALLNSSAKYVLLDMNAQQQKALTGDAQKLYFNLRSYDDSLRNGSCQRNLFHTLPSYAMRADALMQLFIKKQWQQISMLVGNSQEDKDFAQAVRRAAKKYQLKLVHDIAWPLDGDVRRQASAEVPLLTQQLGEYDVLIVADEWNDFARYIRYNTWLPRPIFGGDGLQSLAWSRVFEQWGAAQLQKRFYELADRSMQDEDYAAWIAMRAIDEANNKTQFADLTKQRAYLLEHAELAGFKGRPLSFRSWNGQLRQPIGLAHQSALVAMAPLDGFLHSSNELDGLGYDQPESTCTEFEK